MKCMTTQATRAVLAILLLGSLTPTTLADPDDKVSFADTLRMAGFDDEALADIEARRLEARRRVFSEERWTVVTAQEFSRRWRRAELKADLIALRDALDEMVGAGEVTESVAQDLLENVEHALRPRIREFQFDKTSDRTDNRPIARPTPQEMAIRIKTNFLAQEQRTSEAVAEGLITEEAAREQLATARRGLISRLDLMDGRRHHARLEARMSEHWAAGKSQQELRQTLGRLTRLMLTELDITRIGHKADIGAIAPEAAALELEELRRTERRLQG